MLISAIFVVSLKIFLEKLEYMEWKLKSDFNVSIKCSDFIKNFILKSQFDLINDVKEHIEGNDTSTLNNYLDAVISEIKDGPSSLENDINVHEVFYGKNIYDKIEIHLC